MRAGRALVTVTLKVILLALLITLGVSRAVGASAEPVTDAVGVPPTAAAAFCATYPAECAGAAPTVIKDSWALRRTLAKVTISVNRAILPMVDRANHGVEDVWDFAENGFGDCEDYALVKRRPLLELGLPRGALLLTVVIDETGQGHMILTVRTTAGDFVLDNQTDRLSFWTERPYTYVKRERPGDASRWQVIANPSGSV